MRPGVQLGPYSITSRRGAGGMGEVYRATGTRLDRTVAVKILKPEKSQDAKGIQRFQREALAISKVSHPHICALFDVGEQGGVQFIVMLGGDQTRVDNDASLDNVVVVIAVAEVTPAHFGDVQSASRAR